METLLQDARFGFRQLMKQPGFILADENRKLTGGNAEMVRSEIGIQKTPNAQRRTFNAEPRMGQ